MKVKEMKMGTEGDFYQNIDESKEYKNDVVYSHNVFHFLFQHILSATLPIIRNINFPTCTNCILYRIY